MKKDGGRIEDEPTVAEATPGIATELYGGEGEDVSTVVMEDFEEDDAVRPEAWLRCTCSVPDSSSAADSGLASAVPLVSPLLGGHRTDGVVILVV